MAGERGSDEAAFEAGEVRGTLYSSYVIKYQAVIINAQSGPASSMSPESYNFSGSERSEV